jgi:ABC-2 type transport system ATP-binding protein
LPTVSTSTEPIAVTTGLRKIYGRVVALDGLNLLIPRSATGLLGANGAGKSTLIKLLLGLHRPSSGSVSMLGVDVSKNAVELRARVGYMPEDDCLPLDVTAADFVTHMAQMSGLPRKAARLRAAETLYHCGVDEERYRRLREFSTGMRQRVKLAQAIVHDPEVVFLDEPTNGMDPSGREAMLQLIARIYRGLGTSVLLSSHVLADIEQVCDHVIMLDAGRLSVAAPIDGLVSGLNKIVVEIEGDIDAFASRISAAGLSISRHDSELAIEYRDAETFNIIRDSAADLGIAIRSLRANARSLEDVYLQQMAATVKSGDSYVQFG